MSKYLEEVSVFQRWLAVSIHLASGASSWGTELHHAKWANTTNSMRDFFLSEGSVVFSAHYNKVDNIQGGNRVGHLHHVNQETCSFADLDPPTDTAQSPAALSCHDAGQLPGCGEGL